MQNFEEQTRDTMPSVCEIGHKDRQDLERLLKVPRAVVPLADFRMKINLGPGKVRRMSVKEMAEEYKGSEGGQLLLNGGSLTVPVVDFVKPKLSLTSVETLERMEKELLHLYDELIKVGIIKEDVTGLAKKDPKSVKKAGQAMAKLYSEHKTLGIDLAEEKAMEALDFLQLPGLKIKSVANEDVWKKCEELTELYSKYQGLGSVLAEVKVKKALDDLQQPGLKIRSVAKDDVWKKCKQLYERAGLKISHPGRKDEYDIQMIYVDGDHIGLILIEVKNRNFYPWDPNDLLPSRSLFEGKQGSWSQLQKGYTFCSELFADIPFVKVHTFTALPNTPRKVLADKLGNSCCMQWVLTREDLQQPSVLKARLGLDTIAVPTITGMEVLCTMASRLLGPGSGLYVNLREPAVVRPAEEKRLREEVKHVDNDPLIILDAVQANGVKEAVEGEKNMIIIEGCPGTGKTIVGLEITRRMVEKLREETDEEPLVFVTCHLKERNSPLGNHLKSNADQMGGLFVGSLGELLENKRIKEVILEDRDLSNIPEQIAALGEKLQAETGGRKVVLFIDEMAGLLAPKDKEQASWDWTALEKMSSDMFCVLLFNPGLYGEGRLRLPVSCLHLHLPTTYRSTQNISWVHSCLTTALETYAPSVNSGTEVIGELPKLVVLGDLGRNEKMAGARIRQGFKMMTSSLKWTIIVDDDDDLVSLVTHEAYGRGWTVRRRSEMYGSEADNVLVVGSGMLESISRARVNLGILLCFNNEEGKKDYDYYAAAYGTVIFRGGVEVATPSWHPQVRLAFQNSIQHSYSTKMREVLGGWHIDSAKSLPMQLILVGLYSIIPCQ